MNGFLSLGLGAVVVAFHPVRTGIPLVLTVIGWMQVLKAFLIFVVPGYAEKSLQKASVENPTSFVVAGIFLIMIGILLIYHLIVS